MFSYLVPLGIALFVAVKSLDIFKNSSSRGEDVIDRALRAAEIKHTVFNENALFISDQEQEVYARCVNAINKGKYIDYIVEVPYGMSWETVKKVKPILETIVPAKIEVLCEEAKVIVRIYNPNAERTPYIDDINDLFIEAGFKNKKEEYVTVKEIEEFENYIKIRVKLPIGRTTDDLFEITPYIKSHYRNECDVIVEGQNEYVLKLYTKYLPDTVAYRTVDVSAKRGFNIPLGVSLDGDLVCSLTDDFPNMMILGTAGSGKSVLVNTILCGILENYTDAAELILMDMKGNELNEYKKCRQTVFHTTNPLECCRFIKHIEHEIDSRYEKMGSHRSLESYNKAHPNDKMKYQFVVIDEMMSLMDKKKIKLDGGEFDFRATLAICLSKCRACGIFFLLTSQRPTGNVIDNDFKANIGWRIGLKTVDAQESKNAIGMTGNEWITLPGRGRVKYNGQMIQFQSFYIKDNEIQRITKKHELNGFASVVVDEKDKYKAIVAKANQHLKKVKSIEDDGGIL